MSKDNPQPHHRPQSAQLAELRAIPVAWMQFRDLFEVPGAITSTGLRSETQSNKRRVMLSYLPQIAHFSITFYRPDKTEPEKIVMVPAHHVNWWEPAA